MPNLVRWPAEELWKKPPPWPLQSQRGNADCDAPNKAGFVNASDAQTSSKTPGVVKRVGCSDFLAQPLLVAICSGSFGLASLSVLLWALLMEHADDLRHWARRDWVEQECQVVAHGVQYQGDCLNNTFENMRSGQAPPNYTYANCEDLTNLTATMCDQVGYVEFRQGRRLGMRHIARSAGLQEGGMPVHNCKDYFVPWARVTCQNATDVCAYRFGLAMNSKVAKLDEARDMRKHMPNLGDKQRCWMLFGQLCPIVALEAPGSWPGIHRDVIDRNMSHRLLLGCMSAVFGLCATSLCTMHWWLLRHKVSMPEDGLMAMELKSVTAPSGLAEFPRPAGVQQQWQVFKAGLMAEAKNAYSYQPVPTTAPVSTKINGDETSNVID